MSRLQGAQREDHDERQVGVGEFDGLRVLGMCFVLYVGTTRPLLPKAWKKEAPGLSVVPLTARDASVREHFSNPEVQYVGSTSGCGCDFPHVIIQNGEWPFFEDPRVKDPERDASDRHNRNALVSLLRETGEATIELYGFWDGDFAEPPKAREIVPLDRLLNSEFRFKEQGFYQVTINGES
jgi:hypothetical protein